MIKYYDGCKFYIGEMNNGKRNGKGSLYVLDDLFAGYKIMCDEWKNDNENGVTKICTNNDTEIVNCVNGVKEGDAFLYGCTGRTVYKKYVDGKDQVDKSFLMGEDYGFDLDHRGVEIIVLNREPDVFYFGDVFSLCAKRIISGYGVVFEWDEDHNLKAKYIVYTVDGKTNILKTIDYQTELERK